MLSTDTDGLHGSFLTTEENRQRPFAATTSGLAIVELANVPLGIGTISPSIGFSRRRYQRYASRERISSCYASDSGRKSRDGHFQGYEHADHYDARLPAGSQQFVVTNPDGESVSWDAAFLTQ